MDEAQGGLAPAPAGWCDGWRAGVPAAELHAALAAVRQAFASVAEPVGAEAFIDDLPTRPEYAEAAECWRGRIAAGGWAAVDGEFVGRHYWCLRYLRPEAYRYVLPRVAHGCLFGINGGTEARDTPFRDLWDALEPDTYEVANHGRDAVLDAAIALLTPDQHAAVTGLLGLRLRALVGSDDPLTADELAFGPFVVFRACHPLLSAWDGRDHVAVRLARAVRRRWTTYTWPTPADPAEAQLVELIRSAFADAPAPLLPTEGPELTDGETIDNALALAGTDWRRVHPELLTAADTALTLLSPEAVRYYLPAYLIYHVMGEPGHIDVTSLLTFFLGGPVELPPDLQSMIEQVVDMGRVDLVGHVRSRYALLSRAEREAVVAFLRFVAERGDDWDDSIAKALTNYWLPSLDA